MVFIPFEKSVVCPRCKAPATTTEYFDVIDEITRSMRVHKLSYGRFTPGTWFSNSFVENMQMMCFGLYDSLEQIKPDDECAWLTNAISLNADNEYMRKHLTEIALAVYDKYLIQNGFKPTWTQKKLARFLRPFLP